MVKTVVPILLTILTTQFFVPTLASNTAIMDPPGDSSLAYDITSVSFSKSNGSIRIELDINGNISQGGYFILFDTDRNLRTGCKGYQEMDTGIGPEYFIRFDPIDVPSSVLCSSYRPWTVVKDVSSIIETRTVTFLLEFQDIGVSEDNKVNTIDVVAYTFFHWVQDRAPNNGVGPIAIVMQREYDPLQAELNNTRLLLYIFVVTTIILSVLTTVLARRKTQKKLRLSLGTKKNDARDIPHSTCYNGKN